MNENIKLEVFSIFESTLPEGYSEVSVNAGIFKLIAGNDETVKLPVISKGKDKAGNTVREFLVDGTKIWVRYNGRDAKFQNSFIMRTEDAMRLKQDEGATYEF